MLNTERTGLIANELVLFDQLPLAAWIIAPGSDLLLAANKRAGAYTCAERGDKAGRYLDRFISPADRDRFQELLQSGLQTGPIGTFCFYLKNGQAQNATLYASPVTTELLNGWQIMAVPQPENAQPQATKVSDHAFREMVLDASHATLMCDGEGTIHFATPAVEKILGIKVAAAVGKHIFSFVHPGDMDWAMQTFNQELGNVPEVKSIVIRLLNASGGYTWCMVRGHNMLHHPDVGRFVIYFHDDSQRKIAADALSASEERFRNLVRDLQVGVLLVNTDGTVQIANTAMCSLLRQHETDLLGKYFWDRIPQVIDEDGKRVPIERQPLYQCLEQKTPVHKQVNGYWIPALRTYFWLLINVDPVLDEKGTLQYVVCSFTDITERKKLTQKLLDEKINRQRLLAQATLDGQERERREIGKELHDNIGQQLTTIKLFLEMAGSAATPEDADQMLQKAAKCVAGTINEVRQISRQLVPHSLQDLGLTDSIAELTNTFSQTSLLDISFRYAGAGLNALDERINLALFRIVQEQLTNIIRHASAHTVNIMLECKDHAVHLSIDDDGVGFDPALVRKGIGLTNIQNRVELFGGSMNVVTAPGWGCRLNLVVPIKGHLSSAARF